MESRLGMPGPLPPDMGHILYLVYTYPGTLCVPMAGPNDSPLMGALPPIPANMGSPNTL